MRVIEKSDIRFQLGRTNAEDRRFTIDFLAKSEVACYTSYVGYYYRLVPTSAIQSPRTDCLSNVIRQYYEDFAIFEALGVDRRKIEEYSGQKLLEQTITGLYFSENNLNGRDRRSVIRAFVLNDEIRKSLYRNRESLIGRCSTCEKLLFFMIRAKSVLGLRTVMLSMRIKNSPVRCKNR